MGKGTHQHNHESWALIGKKSISDGFVVCQNSLFEMKNRDSWGQQKLTIRSEDKTKRVTVISNLAQINHSFTI